MKYSEHFDHLGNPVAKPKHQSRRMAHQVLRTACWLACVVFIFILAAPK